MNNPNDTPDGGTADYTNGQFAGPLRLTTARWYNKRRLVKDPHDGMPRERWSKVLAHRGPLTQFLYGTDTDADNPSSDHQVCIILTFGTRMFVLDVDNVQEFGTTRTSRVAGRDQALSIRGDHFHIAVDARDVPVDQWPRQKPIAGADIKSNGWVPVPGSTHWTGQRYEPVIHPGNKVIIVPCTPELLAAIRADQADYTGNGGSTGGGGETGKRGHDTEVAAATMLMILKRLRAGWQAGEELKKDVYAEWLTVAIPHDPGDPFEQEDFGRHYGDEAHGGLAEALKLIAADRQVMTPDVKAWANSTLAGGSAAAPAGAATAPASQAGGTRYDSAGRLVVASSDRNPIDPAREVQQYLLSRNDPPQVFSIGPKAAATVTGKGEITPLDDADWLTQVSSQVTFTGATKQGPTIIAPPAAVMRMIPALVIPELPALDGVTSAPYFGPDGTLVCEEGYNPGTRLILRKGALVLPPVPEVPSAEDVARARHLLETEWLGDFCWRGTDRANAVGLLLTVTGRPMFPLVPMYVIDASVSGAGKGLFVSTLCLVTMGEVPQFIELPSDKEEQHKKITTALLAGRTLIAWDEAHVIAGHTLAMALTAETYGDRILGGNKMMSVDNRYTMVGLGNNVAVIGDMKRRVVPARLVPKVEHPELLPPEHWRHPDLPGWVREHRGELLWAALVIWRNWMAKGRPEAGVSMGSFERFARGVGGALEAAGITGFLGGTAGWLDDSGDDDDAEWAEHLAVLHAVFGSDPFTAKDVVNKGIELPPFRHSPDESLERSLGYQYRDHKEKPLGGRWITKAGSEHGRTRWHVVSRSGNSPYVSPISPSHPQDAESRNSGIQKGGDGEMGGMVQDFPERELPWDEMYRTADHTVDTSKWTDEQWAAHRRDTE